MAGPGNIGISPVLLQAINHTLSKPGDSTSDVQQKLFLCNQDGQVVVKPEHLPSHHVQPEMINHHMQHELPMTLKPPPADEPQPYRIITSRSDPETPIPYHNIESHLPENELVISTEAQPMDQQWRNTVDVQTPTASLPQNYGVPNLAHKKIMVRLPNGQIVGEEFLNSQEGDYSGVLTALASHARLKESSGAESSDPQQIIIYTHDNEVPSPEHEMTVGNSDGINNTEGSAVELSNAQLFHSDTGNEYVIYSTANIESTRAEEDKNQSSQWQSYVKQFADKGPCPICGDKVSGYHYGVYCCESCKGFFKRTVQNKKTFACHRQGDCSVSISSRKKCPACRFKKCIMVGMKVEAIRGDRSRGGRSIYEGCSPRVVRSKLESEIVAKSDPKKYISESPRPPPAQSGPSQESGALSSMLTRDSSGDGTERIRPIVPQLLTDIMNLESLLCDDEDESNGATFGSEDSLVSSLLQIVDQRLYKIVRWARSLPDFAVISTDDQILLLQNSWAELLCLDCCWRSINTPNELKLSYNKSIDLVTAKEWGVEEIVIRLMHLTESLHHLSLDMHEYVCLKVVILMSPDVKGLKDVKRIGDYQDKITDSLLLYTTTHYPHHPNKFGEMLLRLSELARASFMGKELLAQKDLPAEVSSFSLLMELLKTNQ